ncbi:hypothetical protein J6590_021399 [Homalodisca vitripennis]|nr:hypothetical protein J6590_021399 [Homalodisca vitripennis]
MESDVSRQTVIFIRYEVSIRSLSQECTCERALLPFGSRSPVSLIFMYRTGTATRMRTLQCAVTGVSRTQNSCRLAKWVFWQAVFPPHAIDRPHPVGLFNVW